jgi:hypothetical protein
MLPGKDPGGQRESLWLAGIGRPRRTWPTGYHQTIKANIRSHLNGGPQGWNPHFLRTRILSTTGVKPIEGARSRWRTIGLRCRRCPLQGSRRAAGDRGAARHRCRPPNALNPNRQGVHKAVEPSTASMSASCISGASHLGHLIVTSHPRPGSNIRPSNRRQFVTVFHGKRGAGSTRTSGVGREPGSAPSSAGSQRRATDRVRRNESR